MFQSVYLLIVYLPMQLYHISTASCQKDPTRHAYVWQIGPFLKDTIYIYTIYDDDMKRKRFLYV